MPQASLQKQFNNVLDDKVNCKDCNEELIAMFQNEHVCDPAIRQKYQDYLDKRADENLKKKIIEERQRYLQ